GHHVEGEDERQLPDGSGGCVRRVPAPFSPARRWPPQDRALLPALLLLLPAETVRPRTQRDRLAPRARARTSRQSREQPSLRRSQTKASAIVAPELPRLRTRASRASSTSVASDSPSRRAHPGKGAGEAVKPPHPWLTPLTLREKV